MSYESTFRNSSIFTIVALIRKSNRRVAIFFPTILATPYKTFIREILENFGKWLQRNELQICFCNKIPYHTLEFFE